MGKRPQVGIVGAGPAGMMAALKAVDRGAHVTLFDTNALVGRKLLVTGNGRCNLTNHLVAAERYACADVAFLEDVLAVYGRDHLLQDLEEMAILAYATPDGWYYPLSNSAATVVAAFAAALDRAGVEVKLQTKISDVRPVGSRFLLEVGGPSHTLSVDRVVMAPGGKAYPALGSKGACIPILRRLGHTINPLRPALAPIRADVKRFHKLQGVRLDVHLSLYRGETKLGETVGNLMFTQSGFSGPAAMDLSHLIGEDPSAVRLKVNFVPHHLEKLERLIANNRKAPMSMQILLGAVLPAKIPPVLLELAGIPADNTINRIASREMERLMQHLTASWVDVRGTRGFQFSQLSTGGVPVTEVHATSMESLCLRGLYLAGEVLDVVGPCGGYNLQFAFSSGAIAGEAAGAA